MGALSRNRSTTHPLLTQPLRLTSFLNPSPATERARNNMVPLAASSKDKEPQPRSAQQVQRRRLAILVADQHSNWVQSSQRRDKCGTGISYRRDSTEQDTEADIEALESGGA